MKESLRYLQNAKEILAKIPIEDNNYTDIKPLRESFGTAYLAVLEAINEALLKKGLTKRICLNLLTGTELPCRNILLHIMENLREGLSAFTILCILPDIIEDLSITLR